MKYISILRGINVSGQKKIKMADLKILFENERYSNVVTGRFNSEMHNF